MFRPDEYLSDKFENFPKNFLEDFKKLIQNKTNFNEFAHTSQNVFSYIQKVFEKSAESSKKVKEAANELFSKKKHDEEIHRTILFKYSESAALAPADSEELAASLTNRSAFLLHLKQYQHSIIDIDLALSITKSVILKSKLLCRKVQCLLALNKENEAKIVSDEAFKSLENISKEDENVKIKLSKELKELFKKNYRKLKLQDKKGETLELKNSNELPYISEAVSFKYSTKFGKHLVANRDIASGEILTVEKPYCIYPDLDQLYIICSHCLKFTFNSIPCQNCVFAVYCSKECQKSAFEEYHDVECSINPLIFEKYSIFQNLIEANAFFSRLFIKLIKDLGIKQIIQQTQILDKTKEERNAIFEKDSDSFLKKSDAFQIFYGLLDEINQESDKVNAKYPQFFLESLKKKNHYSSELTSENTSILNKIFLNIAPKCRLYSFMLYTAKFTNKQSDGFKEVAKESNGKSFNQLASLINHNCYQNADRCFINDGKFVIFAVRPIKKNEQVYISYGSNIYDTKEYKLNKQKSFNFECNCVACINDWPAVTDDMFYMYREKFLSDKKKYQSMQKVIKLYWDFNFPNEPKDFEPWKYNEETIKQVCNAIDKSYSFHSTLEGAAIIFKMAQTLKNLFTIVYNDHFEIPDDC